MEQEGLGLGLPWVQTSPLSLFAVVPWGGYLSVLCFLICQMEIMPILKFV